MTSDIQAALVPSHGMNGGHAILKQRLRYMVLVGPSGLPALHLWCQKSSGGNQHKLYQRNVQQSDIQPGTAVNW